MRAREAGCALMIAAAALLACKKGSDGAAGSECSSDGDCKNGFLCESKVCVPKEVAEKARAAQAPAQPATTLSAAAAPAAAPEPAAPAGTGAAKGIPEIPEGRSKPPSVAEWSSAAEVNTQEANSRPDECFTKVVREWLKVHCDGNVIGIEAMENFGTQNSDYFSSVRPGKAADFVVRLKRGKTQKLRICRDPVNAALFVNWPQAEDRPVHIALGKGNPCTNPSVPPPP
jgi:hypothetical protein